MAFFGRFISRKLLTNGESEEQQQQRSELQDQMGDKLEVRELLGSCK